MSEQKKTQGGGRESQHVRGTGANKCCEESARKRCCEKAALDGGTDKSAQGKDGKRVIRCAGGDD